VRRSFGESGNVRLAIPVRALLLLGLFHLHFHHRFHGPPFDYVGLAIAAAVSGAGLPGPGESLLIAAGILAASSKLDIASVIGLAFVSATVGGVVGWIAGLKAGRVVLSAPGPLRRVRLRALRRGDRVFQRHPVFAVILTPAWVAGIHHVRSAVYQPLNVLSAAMWAVGVGLAAYYVGPSVVDLVGDLSLATALLLGAFVLSGVVAALVRRRRVQAGRATE
jgi:membrane protein DedA with SNARE-associated domain